MGSFGARQGTGSAQRLPVLVFGPFALARPHVVLTGALLPLAYEWRPATAVVCAVTMAAMLAVEPVLGQLRPPD
jgi:hypothetical protein